MSEAQIVALAGRRVLVTGASGFLGRHLCARLHAIGAEVHGTSRAARTSTPKLRWWQSELTTPRDIERLFDSVDPSLVYHLSGEVNGSPQLDLLLGTYHSLLTSTINLLSVVARRRQPRLILIGSLDEVDNDDEYAHPHSPYSAAKTAATLYARMSQELYGAPVVILRTFMGYGPGQPEWKLIPSTLRALFENRPPQLSSGRRELDWIYVDDIAEAFIAAGATPHIDGRVLEIGTGSVTSIRQIVELLMKFSGRSTAPAYEVMPERHDRRSRAADVTTTTEVLDWKPKVALDDGLQRTVDWYLQRWSSETQHTKGNDGD